MHADSRQALAQSGASDELATVACELDAAGQAELVATVRIVRHVIESAGAKAIESAGVSDNTSNGNESAAPAAQGVFSI